MVAKNAGRKIMKIFLSHSSLEAPLANYIKKWIEDGAEIETFSASFPDDLPPGRKWLEEILSRAQKADVCLVLLSPDSLDKSWLYFEAGLTLGAKQVNSVVPVLYGGTATATIPGPLRHRQALIMSDPDSFNAFFNDVVGRKENWYKSFLQGLPQDVQRLISYGLYGGLIGECILEEPKITTLTAPAGQEQPISFERTSNSGMVAAIRVTAVARQQGAIVHWKFGIALRNSSIPGLDGRVFEFHSGVHQGHHTWTIYDGPGAIGPFNIPAHFVTDERHTLELWFSNDRRFVTCVGIDSSQHRTCLKNGHGDSAWRLPNNNWNDVIMKGWADNFAVTIDIDRLEIDRA